MDIPLNIPEDHPVARTFAVGYSGGRVQATHDIFKILDQKDLRPEAMVEKLQAYQKEVLDEFRIESLRFRMSMEN